METETLAKTSLAEVLLDDITVSETNKMFRGENDFTQESLQELIDSILANGLAQPILLRPNGNTGKYILVAGERRFHASKFIKVAYKERKTIPAYIRNLNDEQAFDLQLTENVERKDIHPMREAKAYQFLHDTKKWTTAEIALRFAKSETYVLQRMKLNTLIEEAAKDFTSNFMTLGHAILIARLMPDDQKAVVKRCSEKQGQNKYYESIHELEDFIQDNIVRDLKEASFDTTDASILPKAGACVNCAKRSGFASQLFADIKDKDRCFDGACFSLKRSISLLAKVKEIVESKPDTIFLAGYPYRPDQKVPQQIGSYLASQKIKVLNDRDDWQDYTYGGSAFAKKITGFMLTGDKAGHSISVYIRGAASKAPKPNSSASSEMTTQDRKEAIARIQERTKRAAELDQEKIYWQIVEGLRKSKSMKNSSIERDLPIDKIIMRWIIFQHAGYDRQYLSGYKINGTAEAQIKAIEKISDKEFAQMARKIMLDEYAGQATTVHQAGGQILWKLAEALKEVPIQDFVKESSEIREKREARAKERIAQLKPDKQKATIKRGLSALLKK